MGNQLSQGEHMSLKLVPIFLVLLLAIFSCSPKDVKLSAEKPAGQSSEDNLKLSFMAFDKHIEALFVIKALLNNDYAVANGAEVKITAVENSNVQKTVIIKNQMKENQEFSQTGTTVLKADLEFDGSTLIAAKIYNLSEQQDVATLKLKNRGSDLTVNSIKKVITLKKINANYVIEILSVDELVVTKKTESFIDVSRIVSAMTLEWDGLEASLGSANRIQSLNLHHLKLAHAKNEIVLNSTESNLIVQLDGPCWQLNGILQTEAAKNGKTKQSEKYSFQFDNSTVQIVNKKISSPAADCASRPVVDLRKLQ